jgi:hypothetical protein
VAVAVTCLAIAAIAVAATEGALGGVWATARVGLIAAGAAIIRLVPARTAASTVSRLDPVARRIAGRACSAVVWVTVAALPGAGSIGKL